MSLRTVSTVQDKLDALKLRAAQQQEFERDVSKDVARAISNDDAASVGCLPCRWARGTRARRVAATADAGAEATAAAAAPRQAAAGSALFGLRKGRVDPHAKLREAAEAMQVRVEQLEQRIGEGRAEAKRLMSVGQKTAALRALRKTKGVEKQVASTQAALDGVELQIGMLEEAELQKTLASALSSSSKGMKDSKKLLQKAETAVEGAAEARDLAEDLSTVMGEFAASHPGQVDDDELLAELDALILGDAPTPPNEAEEEEEAAAMARDAAALEAKHVAWADAEATRRALPTAPASLKKSEKAALLAAV